MNRWLPLFILLCLTLAAGLAASMSCKDMEVDDIPPPGTEDDQTGDDGEWSCEISPKGTVDLAFTPDCGLLPDWVETFTITGFRGTAAVMADGERYRLRGRYNFPDKKKGKLEPSIECPSGSDYKKCSYPFDQGSGEFELRWQVENCPEIKHPTAVLINFYDSESGVTAPLCNVYLGDAPATDDDTSPGDEWVCEISDEDLTPVPFDVSCNDPSGGGNLLAVSAVTGTATTLEKGARFDIKGQLALTTIEAGKVEVAIGCPDGSTYRKCSWPFQEPNGDFTVRLEVTDCVPLDHPADITLNVWNAANEKTKSLCLITLGESTADDDDDNDDATIGPARAAPPRN